MESQEVQRPGETSGGKKLVITCESNIDISVAKDFYALLLQALRERQQVEIDAAQVERVDTSILQLLYAFTKEAGAAGLKVQFKSASDAFLASIRLLGMEKSLNLS